MKNAHESRMSLKEMLGVLAITFVLVATVVLTFKNMSEARDAETALVR